jgi:hypothetical protein
MWVRKTDLEKARSARRNRFSPKVPIYLGALCGLFSLIYDQSFGAFICGGIIGFILIYIYQLIFGGRGIIDFTSILITGGSTYWEADTHFCPRCHTAQLKSPTGCSKCGTPLENFSDWHWKKTEDESLPPMPPNESRESLDDGKR